MRYYNLYCTSLVLLKVVGVGLALWVRALTDRNPGLGILTRAIAQ